MINGKITVYTQVYNTEKYLRECLDSVVNQNYPIHQYIIVDNGCTDGCSEIIKEYAEKYDFIEVVKHETNQRSFSYRLISDKATGDYLAYIDSDDWWEPGYLEKLMSFLEKNDLDLTLTGTLEYIEETGARKPHTPDIDNDVIMTQRQFAENYEKYQIFPAALWGSVMKLNIYKSINGDELLSKVKTMPGDTVLMLDYIKNCKKIGIRNDKLYNYRIRKSSVTYEYNPERFPSALGYREVLIDFFKKNDVFDDVHQECVKMLFLYFIDAIISIITKTDLSAEVKISEALRVFKHEVVMQTLENYSGRNKDAFLIKIKLLLNQNVEKLETAESRSQFKEMLELLANNCGKLFDYQHLDLYIENPNLWNALLNDEIKEFTYIILDFVEKALYKNIDLADLIMKATHENTIMCEIKNKEFFISYPEISKLLLVSKNIEALTKMTIILLSGNEPDCPEDFFNLYIKVATIEKHVEIFLLGSIKKASFFINEKRYDEARQVVDNLIKMGAGDREDVIKLQELLNNQT